MTETKKFSTLFVGEPFTFDSKEAQNLFDRVKNKVGRGKLIEAKKTNGGVLTVDRKSVV